MSLTVTTTEAEFFLGRTIRSELGDVSAGAARELLRLRLSEADLERVVLLSDKASDGPLRPGEAWELDHYLSVRGALDFLKAKARLQPCA